MDSPRRSPSLNRTGPDYAVAGFGLAVLGLFAALYAFRIDLYQSVIDFWTFGAFRYPFLDQIYVGAQIECFQKGFDVYLTNPCDPLGRVHDYSPLWLRLPFLVILKTWPNTVGLAMDALFMVSLLALPRSCAPVDTRTVMFCLISPMSVFALERGNVDVEMFILAVLAAVCLNRALPSRLIGYAAILLGSLLKFYPAVLFALLVREKPRTAGLIGALAVGALTALVWTYWAELRPMAANIPHPPVFTDSFGAGQLPEGIALLLQKDGHNEVAAWIKDAARPNGPVFFAVYAILTAGLCAMVVRLYRNTDLRQTLRKLTARQAIFLATGALLVVGCFFVGRSVGYREIDLLLSIPSLLVLARFAPPGVRVFRVASGLSVFLLWYLVPQRLIYGWFGARAGAGQLPAFLFWLGRELAWWALVAILITLLLAMAMDNMPRVWKQHWLATRPSNRF